MAQPPEPGYRDHLRALADKFAATVPARLQAVADAVAAAGAAPDRAALERVHETLHTIAGSAGSFGFKALGDEARRLEQAVRGLLAGQPGWQELAPQIASYVNNSAKNPLDSGFRTHD